MGRRILASRAFWWAMLVVALAAAGIMAARLVTGDPTGASALAARGVADIRSQPSEQGAQVYLARAVEEQCPAGARVVEVDVPLHGEGEPVCLPTDGDQLDASRIDPIYSDTVSDLVDRHRHLFDLDEYHPDDQGGPLALSVVCWALDDWKRLGLLHAEQGNETVGRSWGFFSHDNPVINLSPTVCNELDALTYQRERREKMVVSSAVRVLVHEAIHAVGVLDEGKTECYATQLTTAMTVALGATETYGQTLTILNQEMDATSRAGSIYDSPDCHQGGPFDLAMDNAAWS